MKNNPLISLRRLVFALGSAAVFCTYAAPAADDVRMPSIYTVPHELDCLLKAGHVQGACCSGKAIYLSHQLGICKIGWDGKLIRSIEAPAHLGDTAYADGKDLFLGCYGGTSRVFKDLKTITKVKLACSEGFDLVPKSISKCDTPVFFVVKALGGNMHGWRKDPVNNPPRIRIDFHTYSNGAFKH